MIHDEICTYEVCKLAREKGFNWKCRDYYNRSSDLRVNGIYALEYTNSQIDEGYMTAPSQSLLQRWLREEKRVVFGISPMQEMDCEYLAWCVTIYKVDENGYGLSWQEELYYDTYELALEEALKYALENLL